MPKSIPITWRPYDVVELEPIRVKLPARPFVGALILTLRDPENHRFAANYVNLVVKPEHPLPRVQRRGLRDVVIRFAPGEFAREKWSAAGQAAGGQGLRSRQGLFRVPSPTPRRDRQGASGDDLLPVRGLVEGEPRAGGLARARSIAGIIPRPTPRRPWTSTLAVTLNDRPIERLTLPDDPADGRGVLLAPRGRRAREPRRAGRRP